MWTTRLRSNIVLAGWLLQVAHAQQVEASADANLSRCPICIFEVSAQDPTCPPQVFMFCGSIAFFDKPDVGPQTVCHTHRHTGSMPHAPRKPASGSTRSQERAAALDYFNHGHAHCSGHWQADYARLHASLLSAPQDRQRIAVIDLSRNGLADRLTSAVSGFYFSLLSGRAFRIHWPADDHRIALDSILTGPNINWRFHESDVEHKSTHWEVLYRDNLEHPTDARDFQLYGRTNLSLVGANMRTVWWSANTGGIDRLFSNPYHRQQLHHWGLRPETAVGCAMRFLFRPRQELFQGLDDLIEKMSDPGILKIGLQIRIGDRALSGAQCLGDVHADIFSNFHSCAQQIENAQTVGNQSVLWYIVTDCAGLRVQLRDSWGLKVWVPKIELPPVHIDMLQGSGVPLDAVDVLRVYTAFAEQWLLAMTDYQIITENSSFGRLAALNSLHARSMYTTRSCRAPASHLPAAIAALYRGVVCNCHPNAYVDFRDAARVFVNVR